MLLKALRSINDNYNYLSKKFLNSVKIMSIYKIQTCVFYHNDALNEHLTYGNKVIV